MNKRKIIILTVFFLLTIIWGITIYNFSNANNKKSNSDSTSTISIIIKNTINLTNSMGITNSNPTDTKINKTSRILNLPLRKVAHATVFFILTIILLLLFSFLFDHKRYLVTVLLTFSITLSYACVDEIHQTFIAGRTGQLKDVMMDSIGSIIAILIFSSYKLAKYLGYKEAIKKRVN